MGNASVVAQHIPRHFALRTLPVVKVCFFTHCEPLAYCGKRIYNQASVRLGLNKPSSRRLSVYDLIPLNLLGPGQRAAVGQVMGQAQQVRRMQELGFCDGAEVEMVRTGTPCIVRLGGKELCFRATDDLRVFVRVGAAT